MSSAVSDLRPLSIGEMLDRAFTIALRHLLPFTAIVVIVVIPQLIVNYFLAKGPFSVFTDQIFAASAPGAPPDPSKIFAAYESAGPYFMLLFVLVVFLAPLSNAAVVSGISRAYLGMPVRFVDCYRDALPRWFSLVALALLWFIALFAGVMSFALFIGITAAALGAIGATLGTAGAIIAIVFALAIGVIAILTTLDLYLAAAYSFVGAVLERQSATTAFAFGFRRVFGEGQLWRSLGIAAAIAGISIGFLLVAAVVGWAAASLTRSLVFEYVVNGVVDVFLYPFLFAVVAVSYYDVRIRREGFDLQMLAAQLGAASASPPAAS